MSTLITNERQFRGVTIIDLAGKIAIGETNRKLHETIRRLVADGRRQVILNLARVTHIDSTGLGEIVAGYATLRANGGAMKLLSLPERLTDLMTVTKLYTVFDIYEEEIDGVYSFDVPQQRVTEPLDEDFVDAAANGFVH